MVIGEGLECSTAAGTAVLSESTLNLDACPLDESLSDLDIQYTYIDEFRTTFKLPEEALDDALFRVFDVKINGKQYSEYTVENSHLIIKKEDMPLNAIVSLDVTFLNSTESTEESTGDEASAE